MAQANFAPKGFTPEERTAHALEYMAGALSDIVTQLSTLNANAQGIFRQQQARQQKP